MADFSTSVFTDALSNLVGHERAVELVDAAIMAAGVQSQASYSAEEFAAIAAKLGAHGGPIAMVVSAVYARALATRLNGR